MIYLKQFNTNVLWQRQKKNCKDRILIIVMSFYNKDAINIMFLVLKTIMEWFQ